MLDQTAGMECCDVVTGTCCPLHGHDTASGGLQAIPEAIQWYATRKFLKRIKFALEEAKAVLVWMSCTGPRAKYRQTGFGALWLAVVLTSTVPCRPVGVGYISCFGGMFTKNGPKVIYITLTGYEIR